MRLISQFVALLACSIAMGLAPSARAQFNPFLGARRTPPLTNEDWRLLNDAASKLNADPRAHAGQTVRWRNASSGASGSIALVRNFRADGMNCHALRYTIVPGSRAASGPYNVNWCLDAAGQWKIRS